MEVYLRAVQTQYGYGLGTDGVAPPVTPESLPFTRWKLRDARKVIGGDLPMEYAPSWGMYKGDHWQGGWGWAGPMVDVADPSYQRLWTEIAKGFCSRNVLRAIVRTHVNGVLARPVRWSLVPVRSTADERDDTDEALKSLIAEASAIVRQWMASRNVHRLLRDYLTDLLMPGGRASLRLFLPKGTGTPIAEGSRLLSVDPGADFAATMSKIFVDRPTPTASRVFTDPETMRQIGVTLFRTRAASGGTQEAASVTFLDARGVSTMVGTLYEDGGSTAAGYQLGGRLVMYQGERGALVTEQLVQQNRMVNYALSMVARNLTTSGFLDRVITEAQMNGEWVVDEETGAETYVMHDDAVPRFGPGEVTVLQPQVIEDAEGKLHVTSPSMQRGDPVPPTGSIEAADHFEFAMRREAGQGHLAPFEGDATALKVEYGLSLLESAIPVVGAARWLIETALAWGEALRGEPGRYTDRLRAQASCFLNVGSVTPEERAALISAMEKSALSRETAQEMMGVEDTDEENDRIAAQPGSSIDLAIRMANAYKMLVEAGLPAGVAAKRAGYSEDEAAEMQREADKENQRKLKEQKETLTLEAKLAPKPAVGQGTAGLRSRRAGRPSGTAERNPGQGQNKGARALQDKKNNRRSPA